MALRTWSPDHHATTRAFDTVVVEIRPGEGGDDAEDFAADLANAFAAYTRRENYSAIIYSGRTTTVTITGKDVDRLTLQRFSGTHRIQRIPRNDKTGRRHTSTVTVAVLDPASQTEVVVDWDDIDVEVFRGSGPGGQHRNKSEQCARLIHRPTGTVVVATASRSQRQNIEAAYAELTRRLTETAERAARSDRNRNRRAQISSGERPVKQWTWNDQRGEVIDHASGNRYPMASLLRGRLRMAR